MPEPLPPKFAPSSNGMSQVVRRNIGVLTEMRKQEEGRRNWAERMSDAISGFAGSIWFVVFSLAFFGLWLVLNLPFVPFPKWDPYPFVMLAMLSSVEAIFLSTFILITQNRMQKLADRRAELDLQISLLSEHEMTEAIKLIDAIARKLGVDRPADNDIDDAARDIDPKKVVREIEAADGGRPDGSVIRP